MAFIIQKCIDYDIINWFVISFRYDLYNKVEIGRVLFMEIIDCICENTVNNYIPLRNKSQLKAILTKKSQEYLAYNVVVIIKKYLGFNINIKNFNNGVI